MNMEEIVKRFENSRYCYAKPGGQGFVPKEECTCGENKCCQAFKDYERFHKRFNEIDREYDGEISIKTIIQRLKPEFEDSQWWKDNIKE